MSHQFQPTHNDEAMPFKGSAKKLGGIFQAPKSNNYHEVQPRLQWRDVQSDPEVNGLLLESNEQWVKGFEICAEILISSLQSKHVTLGKLFSFFGSQFW